MRVTVLASTLQMGGAERSTFELFRRLAADGVDVDVVCLRERGGVGDMFDRASIPVRDRLAPARLNPLALVTLARHFRARGTDVLYMLDHTNAIVWGVLAAHLSGVSVRAVVMHTTGHWGGGSSLPVPVRGVLSGITHVIATASAQARYLLDLGVPAGRLVTIRNGVDTLERVPDVERRRMRGELGLREGDLAVGMVAMFRPEKAHEVLFASVARLRERHANLRVFLLGDGPRREELVTRVDQLDLGGVVRFLGLRPDAPRLTAAFDVVVLTSAPFVETLPFALLEAIAQGVPAVATRVGSLPEIVDDGRAGLLVPPGDTDAFTDALERVLGDPELRRRLGTQGREWICREFSVERVVEETRRLLSTALGRSGTLGD